MNAPIQRINPSFYDICVKHSFNSQKLQKIATTSGVSISTIEAMCNGSPVARSDAEKVLAAFSQFTHSTWTFNNVKVLVLPTFASLYEVYEFDIVHLSEYSGVPLAAIDQMLCDEPVSEDDALPVLQALSDLLGQSYTLENVTVKLSDGEVQRG